MFEKIIILLMTSLAVGSSVSSMVRSDIERALNKAENNTAAASDVTFSENDKKPAEVPKAEQTAEKISEPEKPPETSVSKKEKPPETSVSKKEEPPETSVSKKEEPPETSVSKKEEPEDTEEDYKTITLEGKKYVLAFEDNFDGTELDTDKWERCPEWQRQDLNNYWSDEMSYLDGEGNLIIGMKYDEASDRYLSGGIRSKGKFEQTYGYYEIRCSINNVPGYWTAFWLMGESVADTTLGGRNGTEIDIMETPYYDTGEIQNSLNWDGYGAQHKVSWNVVKRNVYDGKYHTFALLWTNKEYVFYTDGEETWRTNAKEAQGTCQVPLYMKITSEMGSWAKGLDNSRLPDYMKTDYVRVYTAE